MTKSIEYGKGYVLQTSIKGKGKGRVLTIKLLKTEGKDNGQKN